MEVLRHGEARLRIESVGVLGIFSARPISFDEALGSRPKRDRPGGLERAAAFASRMAWIGSAPLRRTLRASVFARLFKAHVAQ